jgi:hypothetical protein
MKSIALSFCLTFLVVGTAQAAIVCGGMNKKHKPVVLRIEETGKTSAGGFKLVNVKKSTVFSVSNPIDMGRPAPKLLEGCENALLAGEKNGQLNTNYAGNLYVECAGDGDAGFMDLKKTGRNAYKGRFVAPNGKTALGLADEEEVAFTCTSN